jgi:hypothetical protein
MPPQPQDFPSALPCSLIVCSDVSVRVGAAGHPRQYGNPGRESGGTRSSRADKVGSASAVTVSACPQATGSSVSASGLPSATRGHGATLAQYAVLTALDEEPGLSSAGLARRAFVTPQTMN